MKQRLSFPSAPLPRFGRVQQRLSQNHIENVRADVRQKCLDALGDKKLKNARIAITAGSRGMGPGNYDAFREADMRLLKASKPYSAAVPFQQLDLLIVDAIGKDISGSGMDLNVIGTWRVKDGKREPDFCGLWRCR